MYKILIVEDSTDKLKDVAAALLQLDCIDEGNITHVVDALEAKRHLKETQFDLLILDVSIPLRKSEEVDNEGGVKLLEEILGRRIYNIPTHIIGLTAFDDIFDKVHSDFKNQALTIIKYSVSDIEWQTILLNGVRQKIESKMKIQNCVPEFNYDVVIITAIEKELDAVRSLSPNWKKVIVLNDASPYYETVFENGDKKLKIIACHAPQMGMNATAALSMKVIHNFRPRYLIMVGIAASIKDVDSHGFGDVFVVDESWDGGAGKLTEGDGGELVFLQAASHIRLESDVSERIRSIKDDKQLLRTIKDEWKGGGVPNTELNIHIGSVASVAGVIENNAVVEELKKKDRKLLGLEMEVFGMYYSARNSTTPKPIAVAFKSVSDFANLQKNDVYQAYACYTSARVAYEFIMNFV